uniref:Cryptochrome DASH n=1 Tax=Lingulaulax polyedra TaxID=160621 RepID=A0A516AG57_LINPO|nr:cryptochrome DASH [Lingulodinium polyedra]
MARRAVVWFRNDLRLRDNQLLHYPEVRQAAELAAVYCIDPRHFEQSRWGKHPRTGCHRARFLAQSIEELDRSLRRIGSGLLVVAGRPEDILPDLVGDGGVLAFQREDTSEEQQVEEAVLQGLRPGASALRHQGLTLFHREDLGWDPAETLPLPFGKFLHGTCHRITPRPELPAPGPGDLPPPLAGLAQAGVGEDGGGLPRSAVAAEEGAILAAMGCSPRRACAAAGAEGAPAIAWRGGEAAGLERLAEYAAPSGLGTYHRTRNQLHGANHSSHLSPWLANGSLSPRTVYWRAKEYERVHAGAERDPRFDHVAKFVFELCWRDYFRLYCAHFGARVFFPGGPARSSKPWRRDAEAEERWKEGRTGVPLVDALMRELRATGFIANRGRYIVASYLLHYLGIDWRVGADWFESLLLDHDVCSNYGEWTSTAGVAAAPGARTPLGLKGRGPTGGRRPGARGGGGDPWAKGAATGEAVFDPWEQAAQYDKGEEYVRRWLPELRAVPLGRGHRPSAMDAYPRPLAEHPFGQGRSGESSMPEGRDPEARPGRAARSWASKGDAEASRGAGSGRVILRPRAARGAGCSGGEGMEQAGAAAMGARPVPRAEPACSGEPGGYPAAQQRPAAKVRRWQARYQTDQLAGA